MDPEVRAMNELDRFDDDDRYCGDCMCCTAEGCRMGPDSTCPTNQLGESQCPCTCD